MSTPNQRFPVYGQQPGIGGPPYPGIHPVFPPPGQTRTPWSNDLCHSCTCSLWCLTCWLPCITFGRIAEIVDGGSPSCMTNAVVYALVKHFTGCVCVYAGWYRKKIRQQYGLEESPCNDYCTHCCCHTCALRQEYLELERRGFDLSIGWNGNIQRNIREAQLAQAAPTMQTGMYR